MPHAFAPKSASDANPALARLDSPSALPTLVLGSSSVYRKELLARLHLPFLTRSPDVDESPQMGERPKGMAQRLALLKAQAVALICASEAMDAIVIGSDQVADLNGQCLGKPGTHDRAVAQLQAMSGHTVHFHTAVAVLRPSTGFQANFVNTVSVVFRALDAHAIEAYLQLEQPYDCAGSAKAEGLGVALLERIDSSDPTALIGLPLIELAHVLRQAGLDPLSAKPGATHQATQADNTQSTAPSAHSA
jgi:septum formation protein